MPKHISLSDVACSSRPVLDFWFAIRFHLVVVRVVGFDPQCVTTWPNLAQPGPAQPGPTRAPLVPPALPMHAPPPNPFVSFDFLPRSNLPLPLPPLSLSPWCPRVWRRDRRSLDPRR
jgi:hypothetical protein